MYSASVPGRDLKSMSQLSGYPSQLGSCRSCNMLLTIQPIFMLRHEISVATSTGVFSLYFVSTVNSLVEAWSVHEAIIPYRDIVFLSQQELSSFSVATSRMMS